MLWFLATLYHVRSYAAFIDAQTGCRPAQPWNHQLTINAPECKAVNAAVDRLKASDRAANFSYVVAATAAVPWLWLFLLSRIQCVLVAPFDSEQTRNIVVSHQVGSILICFGLIILSGIIFLTVL